MLNEIPWEEKYGYHVFRGSDGAKFLPKLETDELWTTSGKFVPIYQRECFVDTTVYRRKIDAGEGMEIVPLDEMGCREYEWTTDGKIWCPARAYEPSDGTIRDALNGPYKQCGGEMIIAFRRPIKSAVKEDGGWVRLSDRAPVYPCLATDGKRIGYAIEGYTGEVSFRGKPCCSGMPTSFDKEITHWQPLPAPPKPELSPAEVAWEEHLKTKHIYAHRDSFIAGFNAKGVL